MTRPSPSNAASPKDNKVGDAPLIVVGRVLAERGHYGFLWADEDLVVTASYGRLVGFVTIGEDITFDLPALVGVENDIRALKETPGALLEMPAVAIVSHDSSTPRLNLLLMWIGEQDSYLCLVMRTRIGNETEIDLAQEVRRRLIAEAEVKAKSKELARANKDLEDYASVISHDLQAPMRALRYQVDDLEVALRETASQDVIQGLDRMRTQASRMGQMLSALLEYSSIGRKSAALFDVDTRALVNTIISSIEQGPERTITVTGDWPTLTTLEQPLDLVLRNLIDNAVKHHCGSDININVQGKMLGEHFEIKVSDNGPGIAPEHQDAIFLPFRTLRKAEGDEVRGLGLAIVHRIVTSVGGGISILGRSDGQTGAVFRVLWPKTILD